MQMNLGPPSGRRATDDSPVKKPSLLDDLFSDPTKAAKDAPKNRADEDLSRPRSLVEDVFLNEPAKARKRFPVWLIVVGAVLLSVVGSIFMYRSNQAEPPLWKEEPKPKLEMATPPPVPPLPGEPQQQSVSKQAAAPEPVVKQSQNQPPKEAPASREPSVVQNQPPAATSIRPAEKAKRSEAPKAVTPAPPAATDTKPGEKPKLLREPEDLAKEQKAFDLLREKSEPARQLLQGGLDQFQFLQYEVIPKDAGQYWVDLVAAQKGTGLAFHFIWAVNPDKQTTRALSQAARDIDH